MNRLAGLTDISQTGFRENRTITVVENVLADARIAAVYELCRFGQIAISDRIVVVDVLTDPTS